MRRTIVTGLLFILVLYSIWSAWALLSSKNTVMALREAGEDKEETINQLSLELRQARNSNGTNREEIHKFISDAFSYLSKAEASDLLKRFWVYEIKVNDYLLPANGIIAIHQSRNPGTVKLDPPGVGPPTHQGGKLIWNVVCLGDGNSKIA